MFKSNVERIRNKTTCITTKQSGGESQKSDFVCLSSSTNYRGRLENLTMFTTKTWSTSSTASRAHGTRTKFTSLETHSSELIFHQDTKRVHDPNCRCSELSNRPVQLFHKPFDIRERDLEIVRGG